MFKQTTIFFFFIIVFAGTAGAQSLTDAVRLAKEPMGSGARAISMGGAAIANANDFSALDWNPAALTLMEFGEINLALLLKDHSSTATFLGTSATDNITNFDLMSIAYASPIETNRGHLAFGISYDRVRDYTSTYTFSAVNQNSSFLDTRNFIDDPGKLSTETFPQYQIYLNDNNLAWALFLTHNVDSLHPDLSTPFRNGLLQSGTVTEEGGMKALRIGGGIDVAENVAVGVTANIFFGSYDYRRVYTETDVNNIFTKPSDTLPPDNFLSAQIIDTRHQSQSGFNLKLGVLASPNEHFQLGFTFETPSFFSVEDEFKRTGSSKLRNGDEFSSTDESRYDVSNLNPITVNSYNVTTPMKFGGGLSFNISGATIAASAGFSDLSQLRYSNADADLSDLNDSARKNLGAVLNWKVGAEYVIMPVGLILRAGFALDPSPYKGDPSEYNTKNLTAGLGILLSKSAIIELTYKRTSYRTDHLLYNDQSVSDLTKNVSAIIDIDDIVQNQAMLSFSFRF